MSESYVVLAASEVVSPLTHMARTTGNEAIVMREPVISPRSQEPVWIPKISGNALRHRAIRETGWRWLIDLWGLCGRLTLAQLNYALHGGNLTEGGGREDTRRITDMQRIFPLSRLTGGCLPDQVLGGSLDVWAGRLVCEENAAGLAADCEKAGWQLPDVLLRPAESFVSNYQYTRSDAKKTAPDLLPPFKGTDGELGLDEPPERGTNRDGKSQLMIFAGQAGTAGALFLHGFILKHVTELELGALLLSLRLWQAAGGTVGGQAARGHGRLRTSLYIPRVDTDAQENAVAAYIAHCQTVREEAITWINDAFAARGEKVRRNGKKPTKPAEDQ